MIEKFVFVSFVDENNLQYINLNAKMYEVIDHEL